MAQTFKVGDRVRVVATVKALRAYDANADQWTHPSDGYDPGEVFVVHDVHENGDVGKRSETTHIPTWLKPNMVERVETQANLGARCYSIIMGVPDAEVSDRWDALPEDEQELWTLRGQMMDRASRRDCMAEIEAFVTKESK